MNVMHYGCTDLSDVEMEQARGGIWVLLAAAAALAIFGSGCSTTGSTGSSGKWNYQLKVIYKEGPNGPEYGAEATIGYSN